MAKKKTNIQIIMLSQGALLIDKKLRVACGMRESLDLRVPKGSTSEGKQLDAEPKRGLINFITLMTALGRHFTTRTRNMFKDMVREFFGEHQDWAEMFIKYTFGKEIQFPEEMLT
jgi:hypothetical protein